MFIGGILHSFSKSVRYHFPYEPFLFTWKKTLEGSAFPLSHQVFCG